METKKIMASLSQPESPKQLIACSKCNEEFRSRAQTDAHILNSSKCTNATVVCILLDQNNQLSKSLPNLPESKTLESESTSALLSEKKKATSMYLLQCSVCSKNFETHEEVASHLRTKSKCKKKKAQILNVSLNPLNLASSVNKDKK